MGVATASSGIATFSGLLLNQAGSYTLTATSSPLTAATSSALNITPGIASKLIFSTQPGGTSAGSNLSPQPIVWVEDANGNTVTNSSAMVTLAVGTGPGALSGVAVATASSGIATFSGLFLKQAGSYTLTATSSALTVATSSALNITPSAASKLIFSTQPGGTSAGSNLAPQPIVWIEDTNGNVVTSSSAMVTLAVGSGPGALSGGLAVSASAGVASFTGLFLNTEGSYTLTASSGALSGTTSSSFTIVAGVLNGTSSSVTASPTSVVGNGTSTSTITVTLLDSQNNGISGKAVSLSSSRGTTDTISAASGASNSSGVVTFTVKSSTLGTSTFSASDTSDSQALSNTASVVFTPGSASLLAFGVSPAGDVYTSGSIFSPYLTVVVEDSSGNTVTSSSASITLALVSTPGPALSGTTIQNAVNGIATFNNIWLTQAYTNYTMKATSGSLTAAPTTAAFTVNAASPSAMTISGTQTATAATCTGPYSVILKDPSGNTASSVSQSITLSVSGSAGGSPSLYGPSDSTCVSSAVTSTSISNSSTSGNFY